VSDRRPEVQRVIDTLLAETPAGQEIALDRVGDLVGAQHFTHDEVDAVIAAVESAGRPVTAPRATARADLHSVLAAARAIERETGRRATVEAIATRTGLSIEAVRQALALGRVMGR
jgi:hypothetical protein